MLTILLIIIYLAFISLGLPDSILGSAWPVLHKDLAVPISSAGILYMITSGSTIISSFYSEIMIRKLGTGKVIVISVFMTAISLLGFSIVHGFFWMLPLCVVLGLGAGAIDSALNNFVALHYKARHMNWLHCFWGVGASFGPVIMSFYLLQENGWRMGYSTISFLQLGLFVILFFSLPLWNKIDKRNETKAEEKTAKRSLIEMLKTKGAKEAFFIFFCYCAIEATIGLWGSTYLVTFKGVKASVAAQWTSLFYFGITFGRFVSGILTIKLNNRKMIAIGEVVLGIGIVVMLLPFFSVFQMVGFALIGLGCAPIFPTMIHETPVRFGKEMSQSFIAIQMSCAYVGSTFMPPLFGLIAERTTIAIFPFFIILFYVMMSASSKVISSVTATKLQTE